jgi:RecA/RadA recombinase
MAKASKEEKGAVLTDADLVKAFLKDNKEDHFNFIKEKYYKVSSGSLIVDAALDGGFTPGLHRFVGYTAGGKTSEAIEVLRNYFTTIPDSKGIYFCAEGRLNKEMREKSGLTFVYEASEWKKHTVFVYESNIYESVAAFIDMLISQDTETCYAIVLDSVDGLMLKADTTKTFDECAKVAGGPTIASVLMKRISIPLAKKGHLAIFISQVRSEVVLDPYAPKTVRQVSSTGGNALLHYANVILQFEARYKGDLIATDEKQPPSMENPLLGHWAKIIIKKSPNEKQNYVIRYPIKYGSAEKCGGIWLEKEIIDCLLQWEDLERSGAWYNFSDAVIKDSDGVLKEGEKFQGLDAIYKLISESKEIREYLGEYLRKMIVPAFKESPPEIA